MTTGGRYGWGAGGAGCGEGRRLALADGAMAGKGVHTGSAVPVRAE